MSRPQRISKGDPVSSATATGTLTSDDGLAERASGERSYRAALVSRTDPANVPEDKSRANWWLPDDVETWRAIPEPPGGVPTKEKPLTVKELMRRERELHLFGRGAGGQHLPDHLARLMAFIVDNALHAAAFLLALFALKSFYPDRFRPVQVYVVAAAAAWIVLSFVPLVVWRATPGKLLLGLRVVRANGEEASVAQTVLRGTVLLLAPLALLDVFVVLTSPHRRRLIDYLTRTRVVANS